MGSSSSFFSVCVLTCSGRCVFLYSLSERMVFREKKAEKKKKSRLFLRCVYWTWFLHFHLFFQGCLFCFLDNLAGDIGSQMLGN